MTIFIKEEPYPNEEDGYFNHIARMERSDKWYANNPEFKYPPLGKHYYSRVILFFDSPSEAKLVQSRLPKVFQELPLIDIKDLIKDDIRVVPKQLIYVNPSYYDDNIKNLVQRGDFWVFPYSIITKGNNGLYTDLRDITSCKWGKTVHVPELWGKGTILSVAVLNGEVVIEDK